MPLPPFIRRICLAALIAWFLGGALRADDYRDQIGFTKLQTELGASLPTGNGVAVTQTEAPIDSAGDYLVDTSGSEFTNKTFTIKSPTAGNSGHATTVATYFYGNVSSVAPGVATIDLYEANDWVLTSGVKTDTGEPPAVETRDVLNASWIGSFDNGGPYDLETLRRLDFMIQRDDFVSVVGLNNGSGSSVPPLLGSGYNTISVGLTNGEHSSGGSTADVTGRVKPEIVSPFGATSFATPSVGSAAALLLQAAGANASAKKSVTVKAILLAGATKAEFPGWSRTATQPLDAHYGAGQLNVYNSYHILAAGQQPTSSSASVRARGWDFSTTTAGRRLYFFDLAAGDTIPGFSALLTWNRIVTAADTSTPTSDVPQLALKLYAASGFTTGAVVDQSVSTIDNVQHIYAPNLATGRYALEVTGNETGVSYGLAWLSLPTVTIAASTPDAFEQNTVPGTFTITRAGETTDPLTVSFTIGGTATNGTDYPTLASTATIPAGANSTTVSVTPIKDSLVEGDETVTLTLLTDLSYSVGATTPATVTIHDLPFDAWRFAKFTTTDLTDSTISGELADPDHDGIPNIVEYALGLEPKTPGTIGLPITSKNGSSFPTLTYTQIKSATDISYTVETSTDLVTWHSGSSETQITGTVDNGASLKITATSMHSLTERPVQFLRLRITRLP